MRLCCFGGFSCLGIRRGRIPRTKMDEVFDAVEDGDVPWLLEVIDDGACDIGLLKSLAFSDFSNFYFFIFFRVFRVLRFFCYFSFSFALGFVFICAAFGFQSSIAFVMILLMCFVVGIIYFCLFAGYLKGLCACVVVDFCFCLQLVVRASSAFYCFLFSRFCLCGG